MSRLTELKKHLKPGKLYRRTDLLVWSNAVDRHLKQLMEDGTLLKLSGGLYYYPKKTVFGNAPANDVALVQAFLKDHRFLITSPNHYNTLNVGTTQLYNETVVYNHKRHGRFALGGRSFDFRIKAHFPLKLSTEFLLVDLVDNLEYLAEDETKVLHRVKEKAVALDKKVILKAVRDYGGIKAKNFFFHNMMIGKTVTHAA